MIKIVSKSINRDAHVTAKVGFVNFVPVIWKTMKMKCVGTSQYPSLLIENEKSMTGEELRTSGVEFAGSQRNL